MSRGWTVMVSSLRLMVEWNQTKSNQITTEGKCGFGICTTNMATLQAGWPAMRCDTQISGMGLRAKQG